MNIDDISEENFSPFVIAAKKVLYHNMSFDISMRLGVISYPQFLYSK
ncbi:hypothetical protein SAMN05444955_104235 [Lihuaxuella thermophila]|uniref:Uncharacterized protein n=1 Tax=Lihuaxuella thermophila TaxID=1173111 RepID=A0A1H8D2Z3_9BACL|nr:hypothetical protein SAMN05444955_104235 [Lihuaxuella thermophila]